MTMRPLDCWRLVLYATCFLSHSILAIKRIIIDYSSQNLSSVPPDLTSSTEDLDLSVNCIQMLTSHDFDKTPRLRFLNLSRNILETIDNNTFRSTPVLEVLDLSNNRLQDLLDQHYLLQTNQLRFLDLSVNKFLVMELGSQFSTLKDLEWLGLSAKSIKITDFLNIASHTLKTLYISAIGLQSYEEMSLRAVKAAKGKIALSNSRLDNIITSDAFASFGELELTEVKNDMRFLQQLYHRGTVITTSLAFSNIKTTWKVLTRCVRAVLVSTILQLSFSDITLTEMKDGIELSSSRLLDSFSVRGASVTVFLFNQTELYDFFISTPARNLSITQTPIIHMTCPKNISRIEALDLSDCALTEKVFSAGPDIECKTLINLEKLVMRANNLKHLRPLTSRVSLMDSLKFVDFSQNILTYSEGQGECVWPSKVTNLDLSSNVLDQNVFKCLPRSLRALRLQKNQITSVPTGLAVLGSLSFLDLTENRLLDLPTCQAFPNLQTLLLRANSLNSPFPKALEGCSLLKDLDVSHNPFICTCAMLEFSFFINHAQNGGRSPNLTLRRWPDGYRCSYPEYFSNTTLKDFYLPEISCNAWILAITILLPSLTLVIAVSFLCNHLDVPWYLKMIWKWTRVKHQTMTSKRNSESMKGIEYHAFVSYSQKNADWVKCQLLPKLEGENDLRVCHHERDFIAGKTIIQNILRSIEKSRRCVFVLSSHFVQSEWCHYELYFANHQRVTRGLDTVILILLEPMPTYLIPSKYYQLKAMMSRRTYLEWPQEGAKQKLFWANLRAALQANIPLRSEIEE